MHISNSSLSLVKKPTSACQKSIMLRGQNGPLEREHAIAKRVF